MRTKPMRRGDTMLPVHAFPRVLWAPLGVGLLFRMWAAWVSAGFYAMDCYFHVLHPAWQWLEDPHAPMPSSFRSAVLPLLLHGVMRVARALGAGDGAPLVHASFLAMGLWSLTCVPLAFHLARPHLGERAAVAAAWLCAVQFLMPHVGTRALVECAAAPPVLASLLCLERARSGGARAAAWALGAGAALGMAGLFRMHVVVMLPTLVVMLGLGSANGPGRARLLLALGAGGLSMVLVQGVVDLWTQGGFLVVPFRYIQYQRAFVDSYGVVPFYTLMVFMVGMCVPPLMAAWAQGMWNAARRHPAVSSALILFVGAHSMVGHKEERFMFTVLPLLFILLGAGLVDAWDRRERWRRAAVVLFGVANGAMLLLCTPAFPRRNSIDPLVDAATRKERPVVHGAAVRLPALYLGHGGQVTEHKTTVALLSALTAEPAPHVRVVVSEEQPHPEDAQLRAAGWTCGPPQTWPTDVVDRLLVAINPSHNRSRMPSTVWDCTRAAAPGS
jgi:hypothetical protein